MSRTSRLALVAVIFLNPIAFAADNNIAEETGVGSSHFIQSISGGGNFGATGESADPFDWSVGITFEKSVTPNPGGDNIVDNTSDFTGEFGWLSETGWGVSGTADFSNTPSENLSTKGGGVTGSYKWTYGSGELKFHPYLLTKLNLSSTTYDLSYDTNTPFRKAQPKSTRAAGVAAMKQTMIGPEWDLRPWDQWKFTVGASFYHYDRDVSQFENQLDSPAALRLGISGFSDTVGGLPRISYLLGVHWYFDPSWDLGASQDISIAAADGSSSGTSKLTLEYVINTDWRAHLGAEVFTSTVLSDTLVIAGIEYDL